MMITLKLSIIMQEVKTMSLGIKLFEPIRELNRFDTFF